jgi:hypothetical protein
MSLAKESRVIFKFNLRSCDFLVDVLQQWRAFTKAEKALFFLKYDGKIYAGDAVTSAKGQSSIAHGFVSSPMSHVATLVSPHVSRVPVRSGLGVIRGLAFLSLVIRDRQRGLVLPSKVGAAMSRVSSRNSPRFRSPLEPANRRGSAVNLCRLPRASDVSKDDPRQLTYNSPQPSILLKQRVHVVAVFVTPK